jgi:hypothetical protein
MEIALDGFEDTGYDPKKGLVLQWRAETLSKAGFDADSVLQLSVNTHVDLHRAIDLVERGCPPPLAARILL